MANAESNDQPQGYIEHEQRSDQELLQNFLVQMDEYVPAIPDAVTNYYLRSAGFDCPDEKVIRMISLAAEKFVSDIASDALQKQKTNQVQQNKNKGKPGEKKYVLTMDDLQYALAQQSINVRKPAYFK